MTTSRSKSPTKKVKKPKPIPENIRQRAMSAFQKLRRLEEANDEGYVRCISCGVVMDWREAQGGHYISRVERATELEPDNVHAQCPRCNCYMNGNPIDYRINLCRTIGEARVKRLEDMKMASKGDEDAMARLSVEDRIEITRVKGKVYYKNHYDEYMAKIKEFKNGNS